MDTQRGNLREFGKCVLDIENRVLWCEEKPVNLPLKAIELLCLLIEKDGDIATKDEIWSEVWQNSFVEETNLTHTIYLLRKSFKKLGENDLIETVPRRGYRFTGEARAFNRGELVIEKQTHTKTVIEIKDEPGEALTPPEKSDRRGIGSKSVLYLVSAILFVAILAVLGFRGFQNWQIEASSPEIKSIAVLPLKAFDNGAEDESLRLRITDALITRLGGSPNLAVRPTNAIISFNGRNQTDALEVGRLLKTDAVIDGRIQRENDQIRVTLQLLTVADGKQIWSEQFDGVDSDILDLQDAISVRVLLALNPDHPGSFELTSRPTENIEAFNVFLEGRYYASKRTGEGIRKSIESFQKAVELDPNFAEAYAGLADAQYLLFDYNFEMNDTQVARAKENLERSLAIKPNLADSLTTLGVIQMNYDWDWVRSEISLKKAIESAPQLSSARMRYGALLVRLRRFEEAQNQFEQAIVLDPLSVNGNLNLGMVHFCKRDFSAAELQFKKVLEINDKAGAANWLLSRSLWLEGRKNEAVQMIFRAVELDGNEPLARVLEERLKNGKPEDVISGLLYAWRDNPEKTNPHNLAYISAIMGDRGKALYWLERSFKEHHPWTTWIKAAPEFESLSNEPRYQKLLRKMNL